MCSAYKYHWKTRTIIINENVNLSNKEIKWKHHSAKSMCSTLCPQITLPNFCLTPGDTLWHLSTSKTEDYLDQGIQLWTK